MILKQVQEIFNIGFETFQQAKQNYCLGHFKTDGRNE